MSIDFDITPAVKQHSAISFERLTLVRRFEDLPLQQIRRGIIYFYAGWSVPSFLFFRLLTKALASANTSCLEIYVVDSDCVPGEFFMTTFGHLHPAGSGETLWIRDGRIVSLVDEYLASEVEAEVLRRTRELLDGEDCLTEKS